MRKIFRIVGNITPLHMDLTFTPMEAFKHFLENWQGAIPKDVQNAKYVMEGRPVKRGNRMVYLNLGTKRIKRLLDKYAPGKYEFREVVVFHE